MNFTISEEKRSPFGDGIPLSVLLKNMKDRPWP